MTHASGRRVTTRSVTRLALGAASLGAGLIHLAYAPEHLQEFRLLGTGFVVAGVFQLAWAASVATRDSRRALAVGGLLSLAFAGVWALSRTVGLPLGPDAFHAEPVGLADLVCCALEVPVGLVALALARDSRTLLVPLSRGIAAISAVALLTIGTTTTTALAAAGPHHHADSAPAAGCPAQPVLTGVLDNRGVDTGVTAYFSCKLRHEHDGHAGH